MLKGDYSGLADFLGIEAAREPFLDEPEWAEGAMWAIECGDMATERPSKAAAVAMYEREPALLTYFETQAFCAWWEGGSSVPEDHNDPLVSTTPYLTIVGEVDPCCGLNYAEHFKRTMPNLQIAEFPGLGHGGGFGTACQTSLIRAFLANPKRPLDTSCLAKFKRSWDLD